MYKQEFNMNTQPWFIRTRNKEEYDAANSWLNNNYGQNLRLSYDKAHYAITNTTSCGEVRQDCVMWAGDSFGISSKCQEIKLQYKTITKVVSVEYPEVVDKRAVLMAELQKQIVELQAQANKLEQELKEKQ